jgi:D-tyrosyl-tRNA(Tyr) deacylase
MRILIQVVRQAEATRVSDGQIAAIGPGLCVYLGVSPADEPGVAEQVARKIAGLRLFESDGTAWAASIIDTSGEILLISNFTLYGNTSKGRRPSFSGSAGAQAAEEVFDAVEKALRSQGVRVSTGFFGSEMEVSTVNHGPTNLVLEF